MEEEKISKGGSPIRGSWLYIWISEMATKEEDRDLDKDQTDSLPAFEIRKEKSLESLIGNSSTRHEKQTLETIIEDITERSNLERRESLYSIPEASYHRIMADIDELIVEFNIKIVTKGKDIANKSLIQMFIPKNKIEALIQQLETKGIGFKNGTAISLLPTTLNYLSYHTENSEGLPSELPIKQTSLKKFYSTIKSRMIVAEVIDKIEAESEFTFDFVSLVVVAATLAFIGLVEDSPVIIVASMLVSPIMGPILAAIFGVNIRNWHLVRIGIKRETYSIILCILVGFIYGMMVDPFIVEYKSLFHRNNLNMIRWPTLEMSSRTQTRGLIIGFIVALPSGLGVALGILGGNIGSLVGVAISASLLPPAVNAGLFWAMSVVEAISPGYNSNNQTVTDQSFMIEDMLSVANLQGQLSYEYLLRGFISLLLTLVNIFCIIIAGVFNLWMKEVTPDKIPKKNGHFWNEDMKVHCDAMERRRSNQPDTLSEFLHSLNIPESQKKVFLKASFEDLLSSLRSSSMADHLNNLGVADSDDLNIEDLYNQIRRKSSSVVESGKLKFRKLLELALEMALEKEGKISNTLEVK